MASDVVEFGKVLLEYAARPRYSFVAWIAFVVWLVEIVLLLFQKYSDWRNEKAKEKETLAHIKTLSYHEARLLVNAVERNTQTVIARKDMDEGYLLCEKGLLQKVKTDGKLTTFGENPHFIPTFVWDHIKQPKVLASLKAIFEQAGKSTNK
jgi:hypothetical protein